MKKLILASTSPYRKKLLSQLPWAFQCQAPYCDESQLKKNLMYLSPEKLALALSEAKALSLKPQDSCTIISGDQIAALEDGTIFSKPGTLEAAQKQLGTLQNQIHILNTAVTVLDYNANTKESLPYSWIHRVKLKMRPLTANQITAYLKIDEPWDCAGSYKFESQGFLLFEKIESEDFTAIQGLPLMELAHVLIEKGFPLFNN